MIHASASLPTNTDPTRSPIYGPLVRNPDFPISKFSRLFRYVGKYVSKSKISQSGNGPSMNYVFTLEGVDSEAAQNGA